MSLFLHVFGMLCGLGSAALAPAAVPRAPAAQMRGQQALAEAPAAQTRGPRALAQWSGVVSLAAGFGITSWWTGLEQILNPVWVGILVAVAAGLQLARPGFFPIAAFTSGVLAGCWIPLLRAQLVDVVPALLLAVGVPVVSMLLTLRRPRFAPISVFEDSMLLIVVLGLVVAVGPQVVEGWRSAGIMNVEYETGANATAAPWVLFIGCSSLVLGGCYSLWWRRR